VRAAAAEGSGAESRAMVGTGADRAGGPGLVVMREGCIHDRSGIAEIKRGVERHRVRCSSW
jgi:hypothetical protein